MLRVITSEYNRFAGDHEVTLYITLIGNSVQINIKDAEKCYGIHLTSFPEYIKWLITHSNSLLIIDVDNWYGNDSYYTSIILYNEFHAAIDAVCQLSTDWL